MAPLMYNSIAMDYVNAFKVPHKPRMPKDWLSWPKPKVLICGALNHSPPVGQRKNLWVHLDHFPHGPNTSITILFLMMRKIYFFDDNFYFFYVHVYNMLG